MSDDTFGFSASNRRNTADKLKEFQPDAGGNEGRDGDISRADAAGERVGFKSREPAEKIKPLRKTRIREPIAFIGVKAPESVARRFAEFCEAERFSYWRGLEELMKRAGLSEEK